MAVNGRVLIGFSKPYVATYSVSGGTVTYSNGQALARGVSVSFDVETEDSNKFYADNIMAESSGGGFTGGTLNVTVDGLLDAAAKLIHGLPTPTAVTVDGQSVDVYCYGSAASAPYLGFGFVAKYMQEGAILYVPIVLTKVRFKQNSFEANTQEDDIEWQTEELEADIMRDDTSAANWKMVAEAQASEDDAEAVIAALLA